MLSHFGSGFQQFSLFLAHHDLRLVSVRPDAAVNAVSADLQEIRDVPGIHLTIVRLQVFLPHYW